MATIGDNNVLNRRDRASVRYLFREGVEEVTLINIFGTNAAQIRCATHNWHTDTNKKPRDNLNDKTAELPHARFLRTNGASRAAFRERIAQMYDDEPVFLGECAGGGSSSRALKRSRDVDSARASAPEVSAVRELRSAISHSEALTRQAESSDEEGDSTSSNPPARPRRNKRQVDYADVESDDNDTATPASEHHYNTRSKRRRLDSEEYAELSGSEFPHRSESPVLSSHTRHGRTKRKQAVSVDISSHMPYSAPTQSPAAQVLKLQQSQSSQVKPARKASTPSSLSDRSSLSIPRSSKGQSSSPTLSFEAPRTPANGSSILFATPAQPPRVVGSSSAPFSLLQVCKPLLGRANPVTAREDGSALVAEASISTLGPTSSTSTPSHNPVTRTTVSTPFSSRRRQSPVQVPSSSSSKATVPSSQLPMDVDLPSDVLSWLAACPLSSASFDRPTVARIFKELGIVTLELMRMLADDDDARKEMLNNFREAGGTVMQGMVWMDMLKRWKKGAYKEFALSG